MNLYFVMNRSAQYLTADNLWTDDWTKAKRTLELPIYDPGVIGHHEVFEIADVDAVGSQRPTRIRKVTDFTEYGARPDGIYRKLLAPARNIAPSKHDAFFAEYKQLCKKFEVEPFKPNVRYNVDGDQLEVYLTDAPSFCDPVGPKAPGIMIQREFESKAITGVKIQCFLERLAGADPSVHAIMMDHKFVHTLCEMYAQNINSNASAWTWKPEELEFFKTVKRLWPGMMHKFLQELP